MHVGEKIRQIRRGRDWTQENLAEKLDLSVTYISKIENGRSDPDSTLLLRFAEALGVPIYELFDEGVPMSGVRFTASHPPGTVHVRENLPPDHDNRDIDTDFVPYLGRIYANPQGVEYFDDDIPEGAGVPFYKNNGRVFALEVGSHSLMHAQPIAIEPGDICVFEIGREPKVGNIVAVQVEQSNVRMVKVLSKVTIDTVELRSENKYVPFPPITLRKDDIVSFAVFVGKIVLTDELKREYGLRK